MVLPGQVHGDGVLAGMRRTRMEEDTARLINCQPKRREITKRGTRCDGATASRLRFRGCTPGVHPLRGITPGYLWAALRAGRLTITHKQVREENVGYVDCGALAPHHLRTRELGAGAAPHRSMAVRGGKAGGGICRLRHEEDLWVMVRTQRFPTGVLVCEVSDRRWTRLRTRWLVLRRLPCVAIGEGCGPA
jgi:hypothetical protein